MFRNDRGSHDVTVGGEDRRNGGLSVTAGLMTAIWNEHDIGMFLLDYGHVVGRLHALSAVR